MRPSIEIRYPDGRRETITLNRERLLVGRSTDAHIHIDDRRVHREHCALEVEGERVYVVDLGGSNGTWIGQTRLLANVREPFPQGEVVHVGPAELRNVTAASAFDAEHDLESRGFMPQPPRREERQPSSDRRPPIQPPAGGQSAASVALSESRLKINPGERASLQMTISNQGKIVDHYTLSQYGLPAAWVTLPRQGVELLPRQSGPLSIDIRPPKSPRTSAGIHRVTLHLLNRQGQVVAESSLEVEILPFDNLTLDARPNPYQSRSGGVLTLTVENNGNAETEYRIDVIEPSDALEISVEPQTARLAPQQRLQSQIRLRPRQRIWIGEARRMPLTVTVTSSLQAATANPVYTQLGTIPRWLPVLLGLACCVLVPIFALMLLPPALEAVQTNQTRAAETAVAPTTAFVETITAQPSATATPDVPATATAVWLTQDCDGDGLTNGEEVELGTFPCSSDTDDDGLDDFQEVKQWGTDPLVNDSDGDKLFDGDEAGSNCTSPLNEDTDGDGRPDNADDDPCAGPAPTASPVPDFALGGHVRGMENLDILDDARMTWAKVQLRYSPGDSPLSAGGDAAKFKEEGYKVLLSVVGHREDLAAGGSAYRQQFAQFLGGLAPQADAIEVWNEPNIDREWPAGSINAADYAELLRLAYNAIKGVNPATIVISAAPAPTGFFGGGCAANGCDDKPYIEALVAAGARSYMDCAGIHYNQGATSPGDSSGHPDDTSGHYSYYFMPMVDLYWNTFNATPGPNGPVSLCFTEIGYLSAEDFDLTLAQVGAANFLWAERTSVRDQAAWLEEALLRSCRSGKVKLFIVWNVDFEVYSQDPQAGYAILRPDDECPACETLSRAVGVLRNEGCIRG